MCEFLKLMRHVFFLYCYFFFTSIGLCLHAHPKPKLKGLYLHIFGNQVELHVFLTHFLKKKKKLTWNKWNSDFYTIKCPQQNKCVRQLWAKCSLGLIFLSLKSSQLNSVILFVVFIKTTSIEWLAIVFFF